MFKKFWEITIRDYNIIEQSGKIGHLVKYWFVPVFMVSRFVMKEIEKANKLLNAKEIEIFELVWQVESLAKINAIQSNVMGVFNLLNLGNQIEVFKSELKRHYRRKIKISNKNLEIYIENLKYFTGIEIKIYDDLFKVVEYLENRKDKYSENFDKPKKEPGKIYLMQLVRIIFNYLDEPINVNLTISEFAILRDEAYELMMQNKSK